MGADGSFEIPSTPQADLDKIDRPVELPPPAKSTAAKASPPAPPAGKSAQPVKSAPNKQEAPKTQPGKVGGQPTSEQPRRPQAEQQPVKEAMKQAAPSGSSPDATYQIYELRSSASSPPVALDLNVTVSGGEVKVRVGEQELRVETKSPDYEGSLRLPHRVDPRSAKVYQQGDRVRVIVDILQARESE